jgi:protease-4
MSLQPDVLVDRRRLKRRLRLWQGIALAAIAAFAAAAFVFPFSDIVKRERNARIHVDGLIVEDSGRVARLHALARADHVRALIVHIDSPGGTVVGGEDLYNALRSVSEQKPVVMVMGTVATSAAYMTAIAGDRIFAREGSITGSIGVILQSANITGLLDKLGIEPQTIKSGPLKAIPSPVEPLTEEGRAVTRALVLDMYDYFLGLVSERRGMPKEALRPLADGRIYTGRQAVANGLIDAIGDERSALAWLQEAHGIPANLPVQTVSTDDDAGALGELFESVTGKSLFSNALLLDGLISVWQPSQR